MASRSPYRHEVVDVVDPGPHGELEHLRHDPAVTRPIDRPEHRTNEARRP